MAKQEEKYAAWAELGTSSENFVLAIAHADARGKVRIELLDERRQPFAGKRVVEDFAGLLRERGLSVVLGDRYSSRWGMERFALHRITYEFSALTRAEVHRAFLLLNDSGKVELPRDNAGLQAQLRWLTKRREMQLRLTRSPQGDQGGTDDLITAVAGACLSAVGACKAIQPEVDYV